MTTQALVAGYFALCCAAMSLSLGLSEILLLRALGQGLPAAGLLSAGVAGYAAGLLFARRTGEVPAGLPLLGLLAAMAGVIFGLTVGQPLLIHAIFGAGAPVPPLHQLPPVVANGLAAATLCITLATVRAGARGWLERAETAGAAPA
ncbi:hypothetical protein [Vannielia litorea]|uniref:hypothetical protein n=1 Tax=Vannielia litorea TaxID=1217970 RepID=UPI001BCE7DD1|nr:hypothetical protein [Vannielia litorea]MBS8226663.1 hypothetical protein [Vannielia litorea]